ncbi:Methylesterase 3 [Bienertia sinuspersici]
MENSSYKKHFVLVHGACHGAWCWYKLKPLLEASGHHVTMLDMAASGINLKNIHDLETFADYSEPLIKFMESIHDDQKVILVGHSLGGVNLAMVMEMFPHKIELAVFLTAVMPDTDHLPSFVFDEVTCSISFL